MFPWQKHASYAPHEIEALSRSLAFIRFKPDGTIIDANQNFLAIMGYTLDEIKGAHHRMFVDPKEANSHAYVEFWERLGRGEFFSKTFKRLTKDERTVWIEASYNPVKGDNGAVLYVIKCAMDVTKAHEEGLDYQSQIEAIHKSQAVIEFQPDGTIITANDRFLLAMGYTLSDIKGRHHHIFVGETHAKSAAYDQFWKALREGKYQAGEFKRLGKDGREVWIQASYNPVLNANGRVVKVVKFATDITEAKLIAADFKGQIDAIHKSQAVIEFEMDGTVITANENFLKVMGYTLAEIQGKHHRTFVDYTEAQSPEYADFWAQLRAGKHDRRVYRRIAKDGHDVWIQASYNPILDLNGKPYKVVKFATDLTEVMEVSGLADTTSSNTQTVAAAIEEMSASINEISKSMTMTTDATNDITHATEAVSASAEHLISTTAAMENIIRIIEEIAGQTNLLALNATIEAARAGEAGKGFAVVAVEVKSLANQTATATEDVAKEIKSVQIASQSLRESIDQIASLVDTVNKYTSSIAGAIEEQSAVTQEISSNTGHISRLVDEMNARVKHLTKRA